MKVLDILLEANPAGSLADRRNPGYYTLGDSHARAIGVGEPWDHTLAINGKSSAEMGAGNVSETVPKGSVLVISLGANDVTKTKDSPETIAARIKQVTDASIARDNRTIFIVFPAGPKDGQYYQRRVAVRNAIKSAINTPVVEYDMEGAPLQPDGQHAQLMYYKNIGDKIQKEFKPNPKYNIGDVNDPAAVKKDAGQGGKIDPNGGKVTVPGAAAPLSSVEVPLGKISPQVADIQKILVGLGFNVGSHGVDGVLGPDTKTAIKQFQSANKLKADGIPGQDTVAALNSAIQANPNVASKLTKSTDADVKTASGTKFNSQVGAGAGATANAMTAVKFFIGKGWTPEQAAGIVGNLQQESGANLNPKIVGKERDGSKAYGIAQWRLERVTKFKEQYGKDLTSATLEEQLEYVHWELTNKYANAGAMLKRAKTAQEAAAVVDAAYEISSGEARGKRIGNALALLKQNSPEPTKTA
jgi:hypothetical protein